MPPGTLYMEICTQKYKYISCNVLVSWHGNLDWHANLGWHVNSEWHESLGRHGN